MAVARPHYLDLETQVVSEGVKRIISYIQANPSTTRKALIDALAPLPAVVVPVAEPAPAPAPAEGEAAAAPAAPAAATSTPEREAVLTDLHWLLHQGHVIEFASGTVELAKKPAAKPEPAPGAKPGTPAQGGQQQGQQQGRQPRKDGNERRERGPRPDRTPWSRKHGLLPVTTPGYPAYAAVPQLVGL